MDRTTESENIVCIDGTLSETNLEVAQVNDRASGQKKTAIRGTILIKVNQKIGSESVDTEIPIYCFAYATKKNGEESEAFRKIKDVMDSMTSLAAAGGDASKADRIHLGSGSISENSYAKSATEIKSYPRIKGAFFEKAKQSQKDQATFSLIAVPVRMTPASEIEDYPGPSTDFILDCAIVQYGGKVDKMNLIARNPEIISHIESNWQVGSTVRIQGRINIYQTEVVNKQQTSGFGEAFEKISTDVVSEFIITGGSELPFGGDFKYDTEDLKTGIVQRDKIVQQMKENFGKSSSSNNSLGF